MDAHSPYEPIITALLQLVASVLLALGGWLIARLVQWLGLKNAAQATANLDDALQKAITYGLQQSQDAIRRKGWDDVEIRNKALAAALPYLISRFPDALKAVGGLDLSNPQAVETAVSGALERAFPQAVAGAASSPATPPRTAPLPPTQAGLADPDQLARPAAMAGA